MNMYNNKATISNSREMPELTLYSDIILIISTYLNLPVKNDNMNDIIIPWLFLSKSFKKSV